MTDENKLIRDASNGVRARQLMENELLTEAFKTLEDSYVRTWRATSHDNVIGREKLYLAINIVGKVRDHLGTILVNGKIAEAEMQQIARAAERDRKRRRTA